MKLIKCTLLHSIFISTSLHVSGIYVPSSGEFTVSMRLWYFCTVYEWLPGLQVGMRQSHST